MNWFIVKMVFTIDQPMIEVETQIDEQWRLVSAQSKSDAHTRAMSIGKLETETLVRNDGTTLVWNFVSVTEIWQVDDNIDGSVLLSSSPQVEDLGQYLSQQKSRSANCIQIS